MESPLAMVVEELRKRAMIRVLRSHRYWSLGALAEIMEGEGPWATALGEVTVAELATAPVSARFGVPRDGGPIIDLERRAMAVHAMGDAFDQLVHETLVEADGRPVAASYLRARLGGPRWKLQASLGRLVEAGKVERSGTTSTVRYWVRREGA